MGVGGSLEDSSSRKVLVCCSSFGQMTIFC